MASRVDKYSNNFSTPPKRTRKNEELYKTLNLDLNELENYNLKSNAEVLGDNSKNVDIEKIKEILDRRYSGSSPKRKSITLEELDEEPAKQKDIYNETRDYDINSVIEKAKEGKEFNYEVERLKKLRDTQYSILSNLNLEEESEEEPAELEKDLVTLINTITAKETASKKQESLEPLDILSDLKGDDNTKVIPPLTEEAVKKEEPVKEVSAKKDEKKVDTSFYTTTNMFTQSDFDDFNDLKTDVKKSKVAINILVVLIVVALMVGLVVLLNNFFGWF